MYDQEFLSIKEVAVIFGVHEATIRRAIKRGWIVAFRIGAGCRSPYRISKASIEKLHLSCKIKQELNPDKIII